MTTFFKVSPGVILSERAFISEPMRKQLAKLEREAAEAEEKRVADRKARAHERYVARKAAGGVSEGQP
jgi:septal ring factor EnvC (AmiA/AmiB activator)